MCSITYVKFKLARQAWRGIFGGLLPILNSRRCRLLDDKRLASQLCGLERRPSRIGAKDAISHPPGSHDDLAAAVAGLMVRMIGIRDFAPKSFHPPFVAERPHGYTSPGLRPLSRTQRATAIR